MLLSSTDRREIAWLTPTSAAKLLACPASVRSLPCGDRPEPPISIPSNAGTLAHLAVQRWVESSKWRGDSDTASLVDHFKQEARHYGLAVEEITDGRMTESRLRAQEPALTTAVRMYAGDNGSVLTEESLYDDDNHLWGTVDLLVEGDRGMTVIDLKSGADAAKDPIPEETKNQLLHYALLVRASRGTTPTTLAVFSLRRGLRTITSSDRNLDFLLTQIDSARSTWMEGTRPAVPSPDQCHFCGHRLDCDAHWSAISEWEDPDATQGVLRRVEPAANGSCALTLRDDVWISDVPVAMSSYLEVGQLVRGVRIRRSRRQLDVDQHENWYATEQSAFRSLPPEGMSH